MVAALVVSRYLDHLFPQASEIYFVVNSNDEAAKEWWVGIRAMMKTFTMIRAQTFAEIVSHAEKEEVFTEALVEE